MTFDIVVRGGYVADGAGKPVELPDEVRKDLSERLID